MKSFKYILEIPSGLTSKHWEWDKEILRVFNLIYSAFFSKMEKNIRTCEGIDKNNSLLNYFILMLVRDLVMMSDEY